VEEAMDKGLFMFVVAIPRGSRRSPAGGIRKSRSYRRNGHAASQHRTNYIKSIINKRISNYLKRTDEQESAPVQLIIRKLFNPNGTASWFLSVVAIINQSLS